MVLWIAMAALAAAACLPLLLPLGGSRRAARPAAAAAMAIYRDQLDEVDRDLARGVIADAEAAGARTEIARRLIREGEAQTLPPATPVEWQRRIATGLIVAMPIAVLAFYLTLGSPQSPDQPLATRADAAALREVNNMVAQVEAHLAAAPNDGKGWEVIAPVYAKLGRQDDAVRAYANALRLLGSTAAREADLGEAIFRQSGKVTAEARAAFESAHALSPDDVRPRFYLALALTQDGKADEAKAAWRALLDGAPKDAPWVPEAERQLAALNAPTPGPSAADVEAAANLSPEQRQQMIEGMVASLAERLKAAPTDADGWARLIRSYRVLGRTADADTALAQARAALAGDTGKLAIVEAVAREFGMAGSGS
jgi:cytochrome c-type biogenesis protein CcmH